MKAQEVSALFERTLAGGDWGGVDDDDGGEASSDDGGGPGRVPAARGEVSGLSWKREAALIKQRHRALPSAGNEGAGNVLFCPLHRKFLTVLLKR